ncbi:MAG: TlpA disulfide reductase family protein [Acidobacteriota bacterium]
MSVEKNRAGQSRSFWTPIRLASTVVVLSLVAAFGASSCNSSDESAKRPVVTPAAPDNPARPEPAPEMTMLPAEVLDAQLKAVTGKPIKLSDYSGKVVVVNLWATWCGPCRSEIPELVKLYNEYHPKGLEVVGLSTENPEASAEGVRRFVSDFGMDYRVGWASPEVSATLMQDRNAIPQSFVIGRDGRIRKRFVGFSIAATPLQLKQAVDEALNERAGL